MQATRLFVLQKPKHSIKSPWIVSYTTGRTKAYITVSTKPLDTMFRSRSSQSPSVLCKMSHQRPVSVRTSCVAAGSAATKLKFYVEDDKEWRRKYGTLLDKLPGIVDDLKIIHEYVRLDSQRLRIIDFGCAFGYHLQVLKMLNPYHELFGVDIAKEAVDKTAEIIGRNHVFHQSCGDPLPLEYGSIDVIYSFDMIEHVEDSKEIRNFFKECSKLIKPSGYVFVRTPNCNLRMKIVYRLLAKQRIYHHNHHHNPFTERKLMEMVKPFLEINRVSYSAGSMRRMYKRFPLIQLGLTPWFTFALKKANKEDDRGSKKL